MDRRQDIQSGLQLGGKHSCWAGCEEAEEAFSSCAVAALDLDLHDKLSLWSAQVVGDSETARVYQEFLKTFQPEDPSADKTFVRGT